MEVVVVNAPYRPAWAESSRGVRALFLVGALSAVPVARRRQGGGSDPVMANSGWSWHLVLPRRHLIGTCAGKPVVVNYRGGRPSLPQPLRLMRCARR